MCISMLSISPFKMCTVLFYLLISLSNKHLQSQAVTQAKTFNNGFTLDLIHRYSPKSPFYNTSMTLQERYHSLAVHSSSRHRHFNYYEVNNFETTMIPNNGEYLVRISIGSPPVDLFVIADTSSDLIWVQCKPCYNCDQQSQEMFDPNQSISYETIPCFSPFCPRIPQMECDSFTNECQYWYTYGNGTSLTSGVMGKDTFTIGSMNSTFVFGCSLQEDEAINPNAAGYIGLNGGRFSLLSQLRVSNQFSYCLTPSTSNFTSKLRLGNHVIRRQGAITTPLMARYLPKFYVINLSSLSIGNASMDINRYMFIDTSSTLTYMDPSIVSSLEEIVKEAIGTEPMLEPPQPDLSLCYDKRSGVNTGRANMGLNFQGGEIPLRSTNLFIDLGDVVCLAIVASEEDGDTMILGNVAQVNFEVEYDLDDKMVSFTPWNCATAQ